MSYCRMGDADIYLYEDNLGVVCFGKNGHYTYGMTKKEALEHVDEHRKHYDFVPESVDIMLQGEYIDELEIKLADHKKVITDLIKIIDDHGNREMKAHATTIWNARKHSGEWEENEK